MENENAKVSIKEAEKFYKKGMKPADTVIKADLKKDDSVVHGAQSVNMQVPKYLQCPTVDWDIYSKDARIDAERLEDALDKKYGGNYFLVTPAQHKGTVKVISKINGKTVADFTVPSHHVPHYLKDEIRVSTLSYQLKRARETLKDPNSSHRHQKDADMVQRIEIQFHKAGLNGLIKQLKQDGYAVVGKTANSFGIIDRELDKGDREDIRELCKAFGYTIVSFKHGKATSSDVRAIEIKLKKIRKE